MISLPKKPFEIIRTLKKSGFACYAVGGSVRDLLMGKETHGWDFTTNATPEEILQVFPDSFYDNTFGTVGVKIRKPSASQTTADEPKIEDIYEITTYRSEEGYSDHRHPDKITWGTSLQEDLSRRDFTINAIASDGESLVDPYNGQKDIQDSLIRAVRNADERFREDSLRMLRAVRFAARFGFSIESDTAAAITRHAHAIVQISAERIRDEFLRIITADHAHDAILVLKNLGLLHYVLPELETAFTVPQKSPKRHHVFDVGTHSVQALKHCPSDDPIIRLATLIHDLGKVRTFNKNTDGVITFYNHEIVSTHIAKNVAKRFRLSKKQADLLIMLVRWHQFSVDERQTDSALRRFIRRVGLENLSKILALRIGDRLGGGATETSWRLELFKKRLAEVQTQPFSVKDLKIDGHDVMNILALTPGPIIGQILDTLFEEVEDGTLQNEREALLARMRMLMPQDKDGSGDKR